MKKFLSTALAIIMMIITIMPATAAFAAGTGTIKVNGGVPNQTYTIYKILDLTTNKDDNADAYSYTPTAAWDSWLRSTGIKDTYVVFDATDTYVVDIKNEAEFARLANAHANAELENPTNVPPTPAISVYATKTADSSGNCTLTTTADYGYYLMDSSLGALCNLTTANPDATITPKNTAPTLTKYVYEDSTKTWGRANDADFGQTVDFKAEIRAYEGAEGYQFYDEMANGLDYVSVSKIEYKTPDMATPEILVSSADSATYDYTVTKNTDHKFTVDFQKAFLDGIQGTDTRKETITIYYTATLNNNANVGAGTGNSNTANLKYGVNSYVTPSTTKTFAWSFYVHKFTTKTVDGAPTEVPLANAQFKLYQQADTTKYAKFTERAIAGETWYVFDGWTTEASATVLVSNSDGDISIRGLDADLYMLKETQAPSGYNLPDSDFKMEIRHASAGGTSNNLTFGVYQYDENDAAVKKDSNTIDIINNAGTKLPDTGGIGTTVFYIVGGVLVVGAVILLITRRRMNAEEA